LELEISERRGELDCADDTRNLRIKIGLADPEIALLSVNSDQALGS
jgi:hypothetical protein